MKPHTPSDLYSAEAMFSMTDTATDVSGDTLCRTLVEFLEDRYRGLILLRVTGSTGGRYSIRPRAVAACICHLIEACIEACPLTVHIGATTDTMRLCIEPSTPIHPAPHTVRRLRMHALQANVELLTEPTSIRVDFPAYPATFALRHPTEDVKEQLLDCLHRAADSCAAEKQDTRQ